MISIQSVHHTAVCVTDIVKAKRFYGEVLGLREVARPAFDFEGAWYELPNGQQIHLIVYPETTTLRGTTAIAVRDGHFAVRVGSYRETLEHLTAHGVELVDLPRNITPWAQIYVTDPDGNIIELNAEQPG